MPPRHFANIPKVWASSPRAVQGARSRVQKGSAGPRRVYSQFFLWRYLVILGYRFLCGYLVISGYLVVIWLFGFYLVVSTSRPWALEARLRAVHRDSFRYIFIHICTSRVPGFLPSSAARRSLQRQSPADDPRSPRAPADGRNVVRCWCRCRRLLFGKAGFRRTDDCPSLCRRSGREA